MLRRPTQLRYFFGTTGVKYYSVSAEFETAKPFSEIPTLPTVPIIEGGWAYLPLIGKYKLTAMHHAAMKKFKEYGPIFREKLNKDLDVVQIVEAEDIAKVFRNEGRLPYRRPLELIKRHREERRDLYENIGIFINNGEEWYKVRSHVQPHMMKPKAIHEFIDQMDQVSKQMVENTALLRGGNGGEAKGYLAELNKWALESVGLVALDTRLGCLDSRPNQEATRMIKMINDIFYQLLHLEFTPLPLWKYFNTPTKKKFNRNMDEFSDIVVKYLSAAKKRLETKSADQEITFLETLMSTTNDPKHITTMIIDMFFAGIDTTSTTVGFTLYHLARNREAQERAHQEVKKVLQEKGMSAEALNEIKFLKACVKESMRLSPVAVASLRKIPEDLVLRGYHVPAGTMVVMHIYVGGRLEKNFSDPLSYRPDRFLREEANHDPFAFLPFGFGPRSCVGRRIAEQEIWILLMRLLERYRVEYRHGEVDMVTRLISAPDKPLHFQFYDR